MRRGCRRYGMGLIGKSIMHGLAFYTLPGSRGFNAYFTSFTVQLCRSWVALGVKYAGKQVSQTFQRLSV